MSYISGFYWGQRNGNLVRYFRIAVVLLLIGLFIREQISIEFDGTGKPKLDFYIRQRPQGGLLFLDCRFIGVRPMAFLFDLLLLDFFFCVLGCFDPLCVRSPLDILESGVNNYSFNFLKLMRILVLS